MHAPSLLYTVQRVSGRGAYGVCLESNIIKDLFLFLYIHIYRIILLQNRTVHIYMARQRNDIHLPNAIYVKIRKKHIYM